MKNIICGVGKFQNDFEYMFPEIKPEYYIWTESSVRYSETLNVFEFEKLGSESGDINVIICDQNKEECSNKLEEYGLSYGNGYCYAEDYFSELDYPLLDNIGNRKIVIWGTSGALTRTLTELRKIKENIENNIAFYLDNNKEKIGKLIDGIEVKAVDNCDLSNCFVIVASDYYNEIRYQLLDKGMVENADFVFYGKICVHPSEMLKKTIYDIPLSSNNCLWPFERANIQPSGIYACGWPSWLTTPIGNPIADSLSEIWNSNVAKVIRLSMLNHTYSFCDERVCPYLELVPVYDENFVFDRNIGYAKETPKYPKVCAISFDDACNLKCPSCRKKGIYHHSENANRSLRDLSSEVIESGWYENAEILTVAGMGEVFYSEHYKAIVLDTDRTRKSILIQTNGTLIKEEYLERMSKKYEYIEFYISIDAARKETFEKLRTGSWESLRKGLSLISKYRKDGKINRVRLSFVVQRDNYAEMMDFIIMAKEYGFDWIYFSRLQNFSGWEEEEFWKRSMINKDGTMKEELIEVFKNPLINDNIVDVRQFYRNLEISGVDDLINNKKESLFFGNTELTDIDMMLVN